MNIWSKFGIYYYDYTCTYYFENNFVLIKMGVRAVLPPFMYFPSKVVYCVYITFIWFPVSSYLSPWDFTYMSSKKKLLEHNLFVNHRVGNSTLVASSFLKVFVFSAVLNLFSLHSPTKNDNKVLSTRSNHCENLSLSVNVIRLKPLKQKVNDYNTHTQDVF